MAKANKDGWIRHRGGKCPVEAGTIVDVRFRNGLKLDSHFLTAHKKAGNSSLEAAWSHRGDDYDIMAYRLQKPEEQKPTVKLPEGYGDIISAPAESESGPLEWRDRIRQIDAEEAERNADHRQAIEALEEERLSLVQKLEAEGFKLIEVKPACDGMPAEDMSDWRKWRVGDLVVITDQVKADVHCSNIKVNEPYRIVQVDGEDFSEGGLPFLIEVAEEYSLWPEIQGMRWHSRP